MTSFGIRTRADSKDTNDVIIENKTKSLIRSIRSISRDDAENDDEAAVERSLPLVRRIMESSLGSSSIGGSRDRSKNQENGERHLTLQDAESALKESTRSVTFSLLNDPPPLSTAGAASSSSLSPSTRQSMAEREAARRTAHAALLLRRLAQVQKRHCENDDDQGQAAEEVVARMGVLLSRMAGTAPSAISLSPLESSINRSRASRERSRRSIQNSNSFRRKENGAETHSRMFPNDKDGHFQNQSFQPSELFKPSKPLRNTMDIDLEDVYQAWYDQESALLRELVVLTLRHSNGNYLRFAPSLDEQIQSCPTIYQRHRFQPLSEGVRLFPKTHVAPLMGKMDDLALRANLPAPLLGSGARDAISLCGECGWLYGRITSYVSTVFDGIRRKYGHQLQVDQNDDGYRCSVARALASRLDRELSDYHQQLSALENELPPHSNPPTLNNNRSFHYLTLRDLISRLQQTRSRLRTLAMIADGVGARDLRGGKLLAAVLRHSSDGDKRHSDLVRSIGADCAVPWYNLLTRWITHGISDDPYSEFFVTEIPLDGDVTIDNKYSGDFIWHKRYVLVEGQIPLCFNGGTEIMTTDLAREVLLVGKGLNFIRFCLKDKDWELIEENQQGNELNFDFDTNHRPRKAQQAYDFTTLMDLGCDDNEFSCVNSLHEAVMESSTKIHSHILESLEKHHHLRKHLLALKKFLFLGQGDFISALLEGLNQEFLGRTSTAGIYSHTLTAVLEGALRTSNARFLPNYVLENLGIRLTVDENDRDLYWMGPPPKPESDQLLPWKEDDSSIEDPWDFVCLEYAIESPLDAIVYPSAMEKYHRVFMFLFRLKRVEWMLNTSWRQNTALNHAILIEKKAGRVTSPSGAAAAERTSFLLRRISSTRQTMLHFVSNLQNYLMFEVLEGGWEDLVRSIDEAKSLDDVIHAHDAYLNDIMVKTLLSSNDEVNEKGEGLSLNGQLKKSLSIALKFGKFQEHIFSNALRALNKASKKRRMASQRSEYGKQTDASAGRNVFSYLADVKLMQYVERTAKEFDNVLSSLLKMIHKHAYDLPADKNQDDKLTVLRNSDSLHFLSFRLDFSGYYARQSKAASARGHK